jgi:hypothetical protein
MPFCPIYLNQAFEIHSLTYPNPKFSGGSHEKEFPEGANMKPPRASDIPLWRL